MRSANALQGCPDQFGAGRGLEPRRAMGFGDRGDPPREGGGGMGRGAIGEVVGDLEIRGRDAATPGQEPLEVAPIGGASRIGETGIDVAYQSIINTGSESNCK